MFSVSPLLAFPYFLLLVLHFFPAIQFLFSLSSFNIIFTSYFISFCLYSFIPSPASFSSTSSSSFSFVCIYFSTKLSYLSKRSRFNPDSKWVIISNVTASFQVRSGRLCRRHRGTGYPWVYLCGRQLGV
jgi:hypothetical protein